MDYSANDFNFGMVPGVGSMPMVDNYLKTNATMTPVSNPTNLKSGLQGSTGLGGLGLNLDTAQLALGGLQTLGSLWQAWEANKLAKEQFNFSKGFANTNLANSIQSYNTALEDRSRARAVTEGQTPEQAQAYIDANRLPNRTI